MGLDWTLELALGRFPQVMGLYPYPSSYAQEQKSYNVDVSGGDSSTSGVSPLPYINVQRKVFLTSVGVWLTTQLSYAFLTADTLGRRYILVGGGNTLGPQEELSSEFIQRSRAVPATLATLLDTYSSRSHRFTNIRQYRKLSFFVLITFLTRTTPMKKEVQNLQACSLQSWAFMCMPGQDEGKLTSLQFSSSKASDSGEAKRKLQVSKGFPGASVKPPILCTLLESQLPIC